MRYLADPQSSNRLMEGQMILNHQTVGSISPLERKEIEMKVGDKVRATYNPKYEKEYLPPANIEREKYSGRLGRIIAEGHGHGLCYEVRFYLDNGSAWYEPDELESFVTPSTKIFNRFDFE